jgi:hypothetical protein
MNSPAPCVACHTAGGSGGRFPHISTDLQPYCSLILTQAINKTMPPGNPGSQMGAPTAGLLAWCSQPPGGSASDRGDPHITTIDGVHYDFQSAGEFVALRDADGLEIQTRQSPVPTANPVVDPRTGLASCVSLNTAIAARVGTHRVSFEPNLSGQPDPSELQLRVDGKLTRLGASGLDLGSGGRVLATTDGKGIEIDFPDGTHLIVTAGWWGPPNNRWYLNVEALNSPAREGIMGTIPSGTWLPFLPDGTTVGPLPPAMHRRYVNLNQKFADAWRVTDRSSLFDYAPGTSTATFVRRAWPPEKPPCTLAGIPTAKPMAPLRAQRLCRPITDKLMNADCVFDVTLTGDEGFAKTYLLTQEARSAAPVLIANLTMQGGDEKTPCPPLGALYRRVEATGIPYLASVLANLDEQCGAKGTGMRVSTVKFLKCVPDARGKGFGPVASTDINCAR